MSDRLDKEGLIERVVIKTGQEKAIVAEIVDTTFEEIYEAFKREEKVSIRNFGTFYIDVRRSGTVFKFNSVGSGTATPQSISAAGIDVQVSATGIAGESGFSFGDASELGLLLTSDVLAFEPTGNSGSRIELSFSQPIRELIDLYFATKNASTN